MEKNWASHRVVYYAAIENNFPFAYRGSDGQPRGYAIDILNIIAQNTGLRFAPLWARNAEQADRLVQSGGPASALPCRWRAASRRATVPACQFTVRCGAFTSASMPTAFPPERSDR